MPLTALFFLLLLTASYGEFIIERVDVIIKDIDERGGATVQERIKFIVKGDYENSLYDSILSDNKLSVWASSTKLEDMKMHINPQVVEIEDFTLNPQPKRNCNPFQKLCHGEVILEYKALPIKANGSVVEGTGLFDVEKYKPRTIRYTLNPNAFSFKSSPNKEALLLEEHVYLTFELPKRAVVLSLNPLPSEDITLPLKTTSITWNDAVLVKFTLIFDVEKTVGEEVVEFFYGFLRFFSEALTEEEQQPLLILIALTFISYIYILVAKKRG